MRALFKSPELQAKFEKEGYVKLPLLNGQEVDFLKSYYIHSNFDNKIEGGFHISLDNIDADLVTRVGKEIKKVLQPKTDELFDRGKVFTASFVIKEPGLKNIVPPHQDWTFVDENEFCSVTVWTALVDVTEENGALGVIPGSHKLFNHVRSSPSPQSKSPLADHIFTLFPFVEIVEMEAGETLIFNNKLIHASPPNLTNEPRIAVGIGVTQEEAQLKHFYQVPGSDPAELAIYNVDESFYPWYNNARLSEFYGKGELPFGLAAVGRTERIVPDLSKKEMEDFVMTLEDAKVNTPLMNKLAKLFNYDPESEEKQQKMTSESADRETVEQDDRGFFQKYSIGNIYREMVWRMTRQRKSTNSASKR